MLYEWGTGKCFKGSGRGLIVVLFRHLPGGTDKTTKHLSEDSRLRFEPSTIQVHI
jgi:hypothetical protein